MSKVKIYPSQQMIKKHFYYEDGHLHHKCDKRCVKKGDKAGSISKRGYVNIGFQGDLYRAHRMIWIYHHNENPKIDIDHIDKNRSNNKIDNLRKLSRSSNLHNATAKRGNKGGCVGVNWVKSRRYWVASICINYNHRVLGSRKSYFDACCLRKSAELTYYKEIGLND